MTPHMKCDVNLYILMNTPESDSQNAIDLCEYNCMKPNPDKCHHLISEFKHEIMFGKMGITKVPSGEIICCEYLFAVKI